MTTLYGIRNCDTVKRARAWLDARGVAYAFHDYKLAGIDPDTLRGWVAQVGWERLLNRAGTTFRKLDDEERADIDEGKALRLMATHTSLIRRPVVVHDGALVVGFDAARYQEAFAAA
jgi:arsenate reductase (glutaredoxin)